MSSKYKGKQLEVSALDAYITLRRATNSIAVYLNRHLSEANLTPGQFGVLEALFHLGPLSQGELVKKILSTKGNITMIIDNLEKLNLVKRMVDLNDRRITNVQLTSQGRTLIGKIFPKHVGKITKALSVLTIEEMRALRQFCKKIGLALQETN